MYNFLRRVWPLAGLIALVLLPHGAAAQATGRITGTVRDAATGAPLSDVRVTVLGTEKGAATDVTGRYSMYDVPAGTRQLHTHHGPGRGRQCGAGACRPMLPDPFNRRGHTKAQSQTQKNCRSPWPSP